MCSTCTPTPWCDVEQCLFCGREPLPPPPPPLWGPLDAAGRTWGAVTYNPRTGTAAVQGVVVEEVRRVTPVFDPGGV